MARGKKSKKVPKEVKAYVKKEISQEVVRKAGYLQHTTSAVSQGTGTRQNLNGVLVGFDLDRGTAYDQREGDQINIHEIYYAVSLNLSSSVASAVRLMILVDKQPDGTNFIGSELLESVATNQGMTSPLRYDMRHKWRILHDKVYDMTAQYVSATPGGKHRVIKFHRKYKNPIKTTYYSTASAGTIADISTGAIFAVLWTDNNSTTQFNAQSQVVFSDA